MGGHGDISIPSVVARPTGDLEGLVRPGFGLWGLYSGSRRYNRGHFKGKKAICSVTTGSPEKAFMPFGRAGNMVEWLWPVHSSLYYVGFDVLAPQVSYGIQGGGIRYQHESAFRNQLEQKKRLGGAATNAFSRALDSVYRLG